MTLQELMLRAEKDGFNEVRRAVIRRYFEDYAANLRLRIEPLYSWTPDGFENHDVVYKREVLRIIGPETTSTK
jgi:hypothetical protein